MESLEKQKPKSSTEVEPKSASVNLAQRWGFSPEIMKELSQIPPERRAHEAGIVGHDAVTMTENFLPEKQADIVEVFAPILMAAIPEAPVARLIAADVMLEGSPYDKDKQQKKAA